MANLPRVPFVVQLLSRIWLFSTPWTAACQTSLSFTISGSLSNSCPLSWWCHPSNSSSAAIVSFCPQSFPTSGTFPMSRLFTSDDQNTGASASASVLPVNMQCWSPLRFTGLISLLSKRLAGIFSSTTVQRHQLFGVQPSLWSSSQSHTWPLWRP